jgi:molybdopterin-guanine dinucleotide biosynthesis protein A
MKNFLVIPMGGVGQRFINSGYKTYKPFLPIDRNLTVIKNIINNFSKKNTEIIIIGNKKIIKKKYQKLIPKKFYFIEIKKHKKGPLFSIYLAFNKLNKIIENHNLFICYSDINWKWNYNKIIKILKKKNVVVFTHKGFHPHLELDNKSDFCIENNSGLIKSIQQKKPHTSDYKKELLAIGCYYFKNIKLIKDSFKHVNFFKDNKLKKEFYLVSIIKNLLKMNVTINSETIKSFVHLGTPQQYEDFIYWRKIFDKKNQKTLGLTKFPNIMLAGGKGKRVKELGYKKPFLLINNIEIFKFIFKKFGAKKKIIVTNSKFKNLFSNSEYFTHSVKKTNSMFSTVFNSKKFIEKFNFFFLLSCDCFGEINKKEFYMLLKKKNPDLVLFGYRFTRLQKKLSNSHTELIVTKNKILRINVKSNSINSTTGLAGFCWIKDNNVFKYFNEFKKSLNPKIGKRELIMDDYYNYLHKKNLIKISYYNLNKYVHIGSASEYLEYNYWEQYFL